MRDLRNPALANSCMSCKFYDTRSPTLYQMLRRPVSFQLLLAPNLLLAHTELGGAEEQRWRQREKTTHLNKKWVPVSYSAVRDFGRINSFVV